MVFCHPLFLLHLQEKIIVSFSPIKSGFGKLVRKIRNQYLAEEIIFAGDPNSSDFQRILSNLLLSGKIWNPESKKQLAIGGKEDHVFLQGQTLQSLREERHDPCTSIVSTMMLHAEKLFQDEILMAASHQSNHKVIAGILHLANRDRHVRGPPVRMLDLQVADCLAVECRLTDNFACPQIGFQAYVWMKAQKSRRNIEQIYSGQRGTGPSAEAIGKIRGLKKAGIEFREVLCCNKMKRPPCDGSTILLMRIPHDSVEYPSLPPHLLSPPPSPTVPPPPLLLPPPPHTLPPSLHEFYMIHGAAA